MTQDKSPEWLTELAIETNMIVFDASVDLYEQGASGSDPQHVIALALSQAYERGQESMRERAAKAVANLPIQIYRDDGIGPAGRSCKPATFGDAVEAIRSLPIEQEGGE